MPNFDFQKLLEQGKVPLLLGLIGIFLVSVGILTTLFLNQQKEPEIEIIASKEESETIWVDLAGSVIQPGVYELPSNSRYKDLLALAGGLSAGADRSWVEKNLNLAQELEDGQKVYIPSQGEDGEVAGESVSGKININSASASELDSLWGIGEARAKAIIENRPYASVDDLLDKKVIPANVFETIKDEITVF
ncbi:MAG TPA: ComEA family DNA-binding protein [Patescibacteria group bacterium]|nr:ComEA family DNA-binding protein [Patescibacteria group bacterium]